MLTGVGDDDIQPFGDLLNLVHGLLVALFVIYSQLNDMNVAILARDLVDSCSGSRVSSTSKDDGLRVLLNKVFDEIKADASVGARDYRSGASAKARF
mgnify:CR=1 FL=1